MENCKVCGKPYTNIGALRKHAKGCFTKELIAELKTEYLSTGISVRDLAEKRGLGRMAVQAVLKGVLRNLSEAGLVSDKKFTGHTDESRAKIAANMMGNRNANHRGDRQSYYNGIRMDSSWEVKTAQYFDANQINWKYSVQGYRLSTGNYYHPDFFIYNVDDEFVKLVEVKGYFRPANKLKFEMFQREYPEVTIELWDKPVLKDLKIL